MKRLCLFALMFVCACAFAIAGCGVGYNANNVFIGYNAVIYDDAVGMIDDNFKASHATAGSYAGGDDPDSLPESYIFTVASEGDYSGIFAEDADLAVDFGEQMLVVYTFTAEYVHPIGLTGAVLDGEDLRLEGTIELVMNTGSACQPYQRWVVVRLDKLSVSSVSFQINYKTVLF